MISATDRFVTEAELDERKRHRQEEWEKVRKPEEPLQAPEEEYDPRSLYDRLKENRDKKQAEIDESRKFKNMIRGLDTDEVGFLSLVDDVKAAADRKKRDEEKQLLEEVHRARTTQQEEILNAVEQRRTIGGQSTSTASSVITNRTSKQAMLLSRAIIKRKKSLSDDDDESEPTTSAKKSHNVVADSPDDVGVCSTIGNRSLIPGIGDYESSSDDDDDKSHKSE